MNKNAVIFDMGNVILPFDHFIPCRKLAIQTNMAYQEIYDLIFKSDLERKFERGDISDREFWESCKQLLSLKMDIETFRQIWSDIFMEDAAVSSIIRELAGKTKLILCSNTNIWHFEHVRRKYEVLNLFDNYLLSYEVGHLKPEPEIYKLMLEASKNMEKVVYIDDIDKYIQAAASYGIKGIVFENAGQLRQDLDDFLN